MYLNFAMKLRIFAGIKMRTIWRFADLYIKKKKNDKDTQIVTNIYYTSINLV